MNENAIGDQVVGCAIEVHKELGPGLLESVYEACLAHELRRAGLECVRQVPRPVLYKGEEIDLGFRLDLLVGNLVVVEVKAIDRLNDVHRAQVISYLKLGGYKLGYLLNFNVRLMKDGIQRLANGL